MDLQQQASDACHNCRRGRLKCDRSLPQCLKCITKGQECLGYQRLFRWEKGVASRGKMVGLRFEDMARDGARHKTSSLQSLSPASLSSQQSSCGDSEVSSLGSLTDPLVQDLSYASRNYLAYFASDVCRDLVLYDIPQHNPFRELIPLTYQHPVLLQIIIANSALRMSNASQKFSTFDTRKYNTGHHSSLLSSPCPISSTVQRPEIYGDALTAKQRALSLLKSALANIVSTNIDVTLAVVLLFIEFELMDSGQDNWTHHINGAKTIIDTLLRSNTSAQTDMSPLRSCLISNCLVFDILGSSLACSIGLVSSDADSAGTISLLQDAEGNHCSSFPTALLQLIQTGAHLIQPDNSYSPDLSSNHSKKREAAALLYAAQSFDPLAWATNLQPHSPTSDAFYRTHIASAHRAAVCIYLSRILFSFNTATTHVSDDLEPLVAKVINHLSFIRQDSPLFKATPWPAFIAGAETGMRTRQKWVTRRFHELWEVEPWGLIQGALGVLERIWDERNTGEAKNGQRDWIRDMKGKGVDWLII